MKENTNNMLTPIERLKEDKRKAKLVYQADSARLQNNWDYLTNNMGTVLVNTAFSSVKATLSSGEGKEKTNIAASLLGPLKGNPALSFFSVISTALPVIWEIAQPMLIGLAVRKAKSFFSSKKKKKAKES